MDTKQAFIRYEIRFLQLQASTLYANNVSKLLLSMTGSKDHFFVDLKDDVVRGSIVLNKGSLSWPPNPPISVSAAPAAAKAAGTVLLLLNLSFQIQSFNFMVSNSRIKLYHDTKINIFTSKLSNLAFP